jgi:G3E family GTPase
MSSEPISPIPLSVITGFLGSGKTTLLNQLLRDPNLSNTAIIINEFGDVGIDHLLVETAEEGIIELSDGCLCCTVRGDLVDTLLRLLKRHDNDPQTIINRIIVETTGLADPAPVLHTIMAHPMLVDRIRLDGVITLVDAVNGSNTLDTHEEAVKQVAMADRIIVSKHDLQLDAAAATQLSKRISALNPTAPIANTTQDNANNASLSAKLFNCGLYNPASKSVDVERWLREEAVKPASHHNHHHDVNRHDASIRAFTLSHDQPIEASAIQAFLDLLRSAHGPNLLRLKGIIQTAENPDQPVVIHAVQHLFHPPATLAHWPNDDHRTRMVIITKNLSQEFVERLFNAFIGKAATDTPDRNALEHNPLAIPGHSVKTV